MIGIGGVVIGSGTLKILERQTRAAKESADTAKRSAIFTEEVVRKSERADILLDSASVALHQAGEFYGYARVVLKFKNFGRTRAQIMSFGARLIIPGEPDRPSSPMPLLVIGANQEHTVTFPRFGEFLKEPVFTKIIRGELSLQMESWLVYKDVFGGSYTTRDVGTYDHQTTNFRIEENIAG